MAEANSTAPSFLARVRAQVRTTRGWAWAGAALGLTSLGLWAWRAAAQVLPVAVGQSWRAMAPDVLVPWPPVSWWR